MGYHFTEEHKRKLREKLELEKSKNWKGGIRAYRKLAFEVYRMPEKCNRCASTEKLEVHHKDKDRHNNTGENLEVLCSKCHHTHHFSGENNYFYGRKHEVHPQGMLGKKHTPETKEKIRESNKKTAHKYWLGKKKSHSEQTKQKMREAALKRYANKKL